MDARKTGELIARLRREMNMNQSDLAERIGVTNKAISRWETGRGYPDIEILPDLAKALDISVQELLDGQVVETPERSATEQESLERVCSFAGQQRRKQSKKFWLLSVLLATFASIIVFLMSIPYFVGFYSSTVGSDDCLISEDYSSLVYGGQTYIPLPMNDCECRIGACMVLEAKVEGVGFLGKLLFGDSLYEVKNVPDNEIVYLLTDYDNCISEYYVLESEYDYYIEILGNLSFDYYYLSYYNESGYDMEMSVSDEAIDAILCASEHEPVDDPYERRDIRAYDGTHIFYRFIGELIQKDGVYYWSPLDSYYLVADDTGQSINYGCYRIDDEYFDLVSAYFSDLHE